MGRKMPTVFFSYSHADEALRDQLEKQLSMLKRQGVIDTWHDRRIGAGQDIDSSIDEHINSDDIILLLVSADFIASDYCYNVEMKRAIERHDRGEAIVIPVILRACDWRHAPFGRLNAVPLDSKPITQWPDIDEAILQVAKAVRDAAGRFNSASEPAAARAVTPLLVATPPSTAAGPRSSNMRLSRTFTQRDRDKFKTDTFEYITKFFENSLNELGERNPSFEGVFRRVDANRFFATIYRNGKDVARGTVYVADDSWGRGINYVQGEVTSSNTMNESLSVEADDQTLHLTSMGMTSFSGKQNKKLSQEGAAELLWGILIGPLQGSSR
jgi:hypothetical protein